MELSEVCQKIFDIALPYANASESPVAGITLGKTASCPYTDAELCAAFKEICWDTALASADLQCIPQDGSFCLKVLGLELFEEEDPVDNCLTITDGLVF